jgi:hypothetical protein
MNGRMLLQDDLEIMQKEETVPQYLQGVTEEFRKNLTSLRHRLQHEGQSF